MTEGFKGGSNPPYAIDLMVANNNRNEVKTMTNYVEINNVRFELCKRKVSEPIYKNFEALCCCYNTPSQVKVFIYNKWFNIFVFDFNAKICDIGISSYNSMCFTFSAYFTYNNKRYLAVITKSHNRLYEVE